jgi:hypothetical protein
MQATQTAHRKSNPKACDASIRLHSTHLRRAADTDI